MTLFAGPDHGIPFYKMQGSGNDFVLVLNDQLKLPTAKMADWARKICQRSFCVGADGLIFLEQDQDNRDVDYKWQFYNSDGSRAEMCGNGSRCAAKLAYHLGLAPARHVLGTDAGPIRAEVFPETGAVKVQLTRAMDFKANLELALNEGREVQAHFVNTGVPHCVVIMESSAQEDIDLLGPALRYHPYFAPQGANVNLVRITDKQSIFIRTYERGVERETFACGTGAAASAYVTHRLGFTANKVAVITSGGERLQLEIVQEQLFLQGNAVFVYKGELNPEVLS